MLAPMIAHLAAEPQPVHLPAGQDVALRHQPQTRTLTQVPAMNDNITAAHLDRAAYIYIRQSTLQQVQHNVESNRRQYALKERAVALGFGTVVVVDDDLGVSGAGTLQRPGFSRSLAAVCNGEVGAVFALEASRLARNNRDWHHLIDLVRADAHSGGGRRRDIRPPSAQRPAAIRTERNHERV